MDARFWINVIVRWLHISSAVVGIGSIVFVRMVLIPAAEAAGAEGELAAEVMGRFKRILHGAVGLLLLTGVYNLYVVIPKVHAWVSYKVTYHAVLGTKILLALILFSIVTLLFTGPPSLPRFHSRRSRWLIVNIILAAVILFLSAILRRTWDVAAVPAAGPLKPPVLTAPSHTRPVPR
jgi:putative copper export protein